MEGNLEYLCFLKSLQSMSLCILTTSLLQQDCHRSGKIQRILEFREKSGNIGLGQENSHVLLVIMLRCRILVPCESKQAM